MTSPLINRMTAKLVLKAIASHALKPIAKPIVWDHFTAKEIEL
jgi:hypothetical protein